MTSSSKWIDLHKHFDHTIALDGVSLEIHAGEIRGLAGENGAGKTTLVKILGGLLRPDRGSVRINGQVLPSAPHDAHQMGVAVVHQELTLCEGLSVGAKCVDGGGASEVRNCQEATPDDASSGDPGPGEEPTPNQGVNFQAV